MQFFLVGYLFLCGKWSIYHFILLVSYESIIGTLPCQDQYSTSLDMILYVFKYGNIYN